MFDSAQLAQPDFWLAPCHSRRDYYPQAGRYFCAHPKVVARTGLVLPRFCQLCPLWKQPAPATFRTRPEASATHQRVVTCRHLGEQIALRDCPSCRGRVQVKVFACRHPAHSETTYEKCRQCNDYASSAADSALLQIVS